MDSRRSTDRNLIEAANIAYHEAEASLYDSSHPEILWCERDHWNAFARRFLTDRKAASMAVLDIGAGTGFIGSIFKEYLHQNDRYVATDISPEMLEMLRKNLTGMSAQVETIVASSDRLPFPDASFDIVVINSALHHFPNVDASLAEAARLLVPGGLLAVMHEPNIRFSQSWFFRQLARATSVLASKIDRPKSSVPRPDYEPVFAHVNECLMKGGGSFRRRLIGARSRRLWMCIRQRLGEGMKPSVLIRLNGG
jgi:ubiquinone/menaquinone biosynthesis C-methylase UbiE